MSPKRRRTAPEGSTRFRRMGRPVLQAVSRRPPAGHTQPLVPTWINGKHPQAWDRHYATCRNWQSAWMMVVGPDALQGGGSVAPVHSGSGLW